jgi:hypothetical protein
VPALVACNAIVGIDDFRKTECGPNPCPPPDAGPDQIAPDNFVPDTGRDAPPDAPPGVSPVAWADFPMPNYKVGADASAPRPLNYEIITPEEVEDNETRRVWRRGVIGNLPGTDFSEEQAVAKCKEIPFGPWRLPKRIELVSLLSHAAGFPTIDTTIFNRVPADVVWTSSEVRPFNGKYWAVDFKVGALVQLDTKIEFAKVICVKDKQ